MSKYKITAEIWRIGDTEHPTEKFSKRELVLKTDDQYSPYISMQMVQNNTGLPEQLHLQCGDVVTVTFAIGGRLSNKEGSDKVWNDITALYVEPA